MNFNKKLAVAVSGAMLLMAGQFALADSATDIVDALVSKGVLTEEEGKLITKGHTSKTAVTPVVKEKDGTFTLESANGQNSLSVNGRLHFDHREFNYPDPNWGAPAEPKGADTFDMRRARIGVKGKFAKYYSGEVVLNMVGVSGFDIIDVAYLDVNWFEKAKFRFGQFKMPFSLEQLTSSNNIDFIERSFVDGYIPAKERGAQVFGEPFTGVTYGLAVSTGHKSVENTGAAARELDNYADGKDVIGRATINFAEIAGNKEMVLHAGLALSKGDQGQSTVDGVGGAQKTRTRSDVTFFTPGTPGTGIGSDRSIDRTRVGLEGVAAYGPFKLQGQYLQTNYDYLTAGASKDLDINTMYLQALWTISGESHASRYKAGAFGGLKPSKNFNPDDFSGGAWEVGFRYGKFDASDFKDASVMTGFAEAQDYTVGLKFVPSPNVRFMMDYVKTDFENRNSTNIIYVGGKSVEHEKAILFRTQLSF
jgi:phosphate-selective porin OprO and OprP